MGPVLPQLEAVSSHAHSSWRARRDRARLGWFGYLVPISWPPRARPSILDARPSRAGAPAATAPTATAARWGRRSRCASRRSTMQQLAKLIRDGLPAKGMPPNVDRRSRAGRAREVPADDSAPPAAPSCARRSRRPTADARRPGARRGLRRSAAAHGRQARAPAAARRAIAFREVTSETGWPTYNGEPGGNRYTTLTQIDKTNVARLAPTWMFTLPDAGNLQVTPVVVDGIMYVTAPNECYRARRRQRPADLALQAAAHQGLSPAAARTAASASPAIACSW